MDVSLQAIKPLIINAISLAILDAGIDVYDIVIASSAGYLFQFQKQPVIGLLKRHEL